MSDSLNNFIDKAGQSVSEKLSRAVLGKPVDVTGAPNHSGNYVGPADNGQNKTNFVPLTKKPDSFQVSPAVRLNESNSAGFTPLSYYKVDVNGDPISEESSIPFAVGYKIKPNGEIDTAQTKFDRRKDSYFNKDNYNKFGFNDKSTSDFILALADSDLENWPDGKRPSFDSIMKISAGIGPDNNNFNSSISSIGYTPYENEDPVYFGFEIEIDVLNSPLINGQALKFLKDFTTDYDEIKSRIPILESFIYELSRYFRFNTDKVDTRVLSNIENLFGTRLNKKFYVKKVDGLDKLVEANQPNAPSAFIKYRTDVLKIAFQEDTNLSTGTLASLYKLLYWSRLNGKNIIPENLLRFDCKIIVSEARNLARIRKAAAGEINLDVIRENVSRYVYSLYECQFFFKSVTHPSSIDLGQPAQFATDWEIELTYKFSDMKFERFVFNDDFGAYKSLNNRGLNPLGATSSIGVTDAPISPVLLKRIPEQSTPAVSTEENPSNDILKDAKENDLKSRFAKSVSEAGGKLLENLKKAGLNEAQRQLNNQFRLLNNTLDKVRNSFGIGRMAPPTNVYQGAQPGTFFFDVQNSLRNFAGDTLSGTIFGNND